MTYRQSNDRRSPVPTAPPPLSDQQRFLRDVLQGLSRKPKSLPCKYLYDERGSQLFDEICRLEEYYPTRTELAIMQQHAPQIGAAFPGDLMLVEYGSGSSVKTRLLLDHLPGRIRYFPVDISKEHLLLSAARLAKQYPDIEVRPILADFTEPFSLPQAPEADERVVVYFPGSTIGNFLPTDARQLLGHIANLCQPDGGLLIGIDLQKDVTTLEKAYNDQRGVTAEFNRNLLRRINRELDANFDISRFAHRAVYNRELGRMELSLVSCDKQSVQIGKHRFTFLPGEAICTEYSHKYRVNEFARLAASAGLQLDRYWTDARQWFALLKFSV